MNITEIGNYFISRDNLGVVNAINKIDNGASLLYNAQTKEFDEEDAMTIELRAWERSHGALDLSDFPPDERTAMDDEGGGGEDMIL